jgi:hypothetical protein
MIVVVMIIINDDDDDDDDRRNPDPNPNPNPRRCGAAAGPARRQGRATVRIITGLLLAEGRWRRQSFLKQRERAQQQ